MNVRPLALAACLAFLPCPADAQAPTAPLQVPYRLFTLPNGLTVILHQDRSVPMVAVNTTGERREAEADDRRDGRAPAVNGTGLIGPCRLDSPKIRPRHRATARFDAPPGGVASPQGASLYYCGQQGPPLVMEQVPESWWEWGINNASMFVWNQVMDVFRYTDDDGSYSFQNWPSQESEFIGYPSSSDLDDVYGAGWDPGTLAITWTWTFFDCGSIKESDIAWNPA